jgi:hypothetical protein
MGESARVRVVGVSPKQGLFIQMLIHKTTTGLPPQEILCPAHLLGKRIAMRARCANGPYAGQTFEFPHPRINYRPAVSAWLIGPLIWINYGVDKHCYQLVSNGWFRDWRLVYQDTF